MVKDEGAQPSAASNTDTSQASDGSGADGQQAENLQDKPPKEAISESQKTETAGEPKEGEPKKEASPDDPSEEPNQPAKEGEETLEQYFNTEESVTFNKRKKFPDIKEGDITRDTGGKQIVHAEHIRNDTEAILGRVENGEEVGKPNLKLFLGIRDSNPKKAKALAQLWGFRSANHAGAAFEDYMDAKTAEDKSSVINEQFPDWIRYTDVDMPFSWQIQKDTGSDTIKSDKKAFTWSQKELDRAINDHVADNEISKEVIVKSAKLRKLLGEFSGFSENGEPVSASRALSLAISMAGLEGVKTEKKKSLGGGTKVKQPKSTNKKEGLSDGAKSLAASVGYNLN